MTHESHVFTREEYEEALELGKRRRDAQDPFQQRWGPTLNDQAYSFLAEWAVADSLHLPRPKELFDCGWDLEAAQVRLDVKWSNWNKDRAGLLVSDYHRRRAHWFVATCWDDPLVDGVWGNGVAIIGVAARTTFEQHARYTNRPGPFRVMDPEHLTPWQEVKEDLMSH